MTFWYIRKNTGKCQNCTKKAICAILQIELSSLRSSACSFTKRTQQSAEQCLQFYKSYSTVCGVVLVVLQTHSAVCEVVLAVLQILLNSLRSSACSFTNALSSLRSCACKIANRTQQTAEMAFRGQKHTSTTPLLYKAVKQSQMKCRCMCINDTTARLGKASKEQKRMTEPHFNTIHQYYFANFLPKIKRLRILRIYFFVSKPLFLYLYKS